MNSSHGMKGSSSFIHMILPTAILLFLLAASPFADTAVALTVTGGIVEYVSGPVVAVRGKNYNIGGARIMTPSGKTLAPTELARGRKVDLHEEHGRIVAVIIYPSMVE
jgi:hypothetical protein